MDPCLVRSESRSLRKLAGLLGAALLAGSVRAAFEPGPWALYPGGIEPGDASVCQAPGGNRCWYVDAQAPAGGNGSYSSPFRSFERIAGRYGDSAIGNGPGNYIQGDLYVNCGDHILVKGIFRATENEEATRKTQLLLLQPCGSPPGQDFSGRTLVIKSWPGQPRAIFEGDIPGPYQDGDVIPPLDLRRTGYLIDIGTEQSVFRSVRIENIEFNRAFSGGIRIYDHVERAEIVGVEVHNTHNFGRSAWNGGVVLFARSARHQYIVRNGLFHHNYEGYDCVGECEFQNIAGINVLGEVPGDALDGSTVEIRDNVVHNEKMGIIHKHTANAAFSAHNNLIYNVNTAFLLREKDNFVHHNIIHHSTSAVSLYWTLKLDNSISGRIHHNTVYNCRRLLDSHPDEAVNPPRVRSLDFENNIFFNNGFGSSNGVYFLSPETDPGVSLSTWRFGPDLYSYPFPERSDANGFGRGTAFVYKRGAPSTMNYDEGTAYLAGQTLAPGDAFIFGNPLFSDPSGVEAPPTATAAAVARTVAALRLTETSPARGSGSGGLDMGALPYGVSPATPVRPRRLRIR
jgi:hypothetical protein